MKRGDVYWADLRARAGSEQKGMRPVILLSHDAFNQTPGWKSVIVVPVSTSESQRGRGPTAIPLPKGAGGLTRDSVALCHQITTIDRARLVKYMGALPPEFLQRVGKGVLAAVDLL